MKCMAQGVARRLHLRGYNRRQWEEEDDEICPRFTEYSDATMGEDEEEASDEPADDWWRVDDRLVGNPKRKVW
jgi:hypothetical protein